MTRPKIVAADPGGTAATLREHMDALWATGRPDARGWSRLWLDPLRWVVALPAVDPDGELTYFFVRLDGRRYDQWPPEVQFVDPDDWEPATGGRWWPDVDPHGDPAREPWFDLRPRHDFDDGDPRPLVSFSLALGYYETDPALAPDDQWIQGRHTVAATLDRLAEILGPPYFRGVSR
jgi:hypothetical protein